MERTIKATNRHSAEAFISKYGQIDIKESKNAPGKHFFTAGDITGYVSPKAWEAVEEGKSKEHFQLAEVSVNDQQPIWCLMVVGNAQPVVASLK